MYPWGCSHLVARLVQHPLMDSLLAWLVPCLVMDSLGGWCFSRLACVHLELKDLRILAGCIEAPCSRSVHLFGTAFRCFDSEVSVCKATASPSSSQEPILKPVGALQLNGVLLHSDHGFVGEPRHFGQLFLWVTLRLLALSLDAVRIMDLLGMMAMSARPSLVVSAS